ncbi:MULTISPECIES: Gfo/Idh/MocA family protein [Streptomyces]|uniref:Gfo/Idh/MocA family protein n=1 Tax=Streptomyces TaxID=1883 RepID=UPI00069C7515|nr:Gfo/Idh/MocA family oxidoreductase [Streptomyces sp. SID7805]MYU55295.1 Gfo/Idh/MocA family oxidoreductase [Streptomyces sp. SID7805]
MTPPDSRTPVRFGVLGCADIAWRRTLPALCANPDATPVAIASRTPQKAQRFADRFGCAAVHGYDALLARPDIDAVYVPLPAMLLAPWVTRALEAGKHVFAEKPLSASRAESEALVRLARERGLVLRENAMFLHHSQHARVADLVADGAIGELRGFRSAFTIPPKPDGDIRYQPEVGGGALLDVAVYPLRAALYFLGPELTVVGATLRRRQGAVLSGSVLLTTPSGIPAQLSFGMEHSYRTDYEILGSTGRLSLDRVFTPPASWQPVVRVERQDHREEIVLPADDQFARIIEDFVGAVVHDAGTGSELDASVRLVGLIDDMARQAVYADR